MHLGSIVRDFVVICAESYKSYIGLMIAKCALSVLVIDIVQI